MRTFKSRGGREPPSSRSAPAPGIPARLAAFEARIVELEREFQAPKSGGKGEAMRAELDLLRRDMRKIGEKLGFDPEA